MGHEDGPANALARVGRVLKNKWRLERLLAVGGMGAIYEAEHRNGKRVAIKILHAELCRDPNQRKRFLREGYAANRIGDPRVVTVDDDDVEDDGSPFLVMELLEGESLDRTLERLNRRIPMSIALPLMDQLLGVLQKAHAKRIVHRDIKPENLFLTSHGSLKVLDFGLARLRETDTEANSDTSMTTIMGTPAYMAPEQARGRWDLVDERTDLWSVGATLFRLLSGRYVHEAATSIEQLGLAMTAPARSLASVMPELPANLIATVDRALEYEREERWSSAQAMREALCGHRECFAEGTATPAESAVYSNPSRTIESTSAAIVRAPGSDSHGSTRNSLFTRPSEVLTKGANFTGLMRAAEERGGPHVRDQILSHLPKRVAEPIRYGQVVTVGWYPVEWYAALHSALDQVLGGGPELARTLGRETTLADFTNLHRALARMLKIETVFGQAPRLMKLYWKGGQIDCPEVGSGYGRLSFSDWHGFTRLIWEDLAGSIEAILTLCSAEDVNCTSFGSMDAAHTLEIHVHWRNHAPRVERAAW